MDLSITPEDWEYRTIADLAARRSNSIVGGPFGSDLVSKDYVPFGVPVIRGQNMGGGRIAGDFVFVSFEKAKYLQANTAKPGDIVFTQRGTLGQVSLVPDDSFKLYVVSQSQMKLTPDLSKYDPGYLLQYFASEPGQRQILESAIQTGVPHTNLGILRSYKLAIPTQQDEQRAIAAALNDADALIASLDALIAKKRDLKQAAMQQLLTGKTRLPGFNGNWKIKRLGDLLEYEQPTKYLVSSSEYSDKNEVPVLTAGKTFILGFTNETDGIFTSLPAIIFDDFTTATKFVTLQFKVKSSAMKILKPRTKEIHLHLIYELMQMIDFRLSDHKRYWISEYQNIEIQIPGIEEQSAIAIALSEMNADIIGLEAKRDKARAIKQGMMQELLTGRIRLV